MPLGNMLDLFTSSPQIDASYIDPGSTTPLPPDHLHGLYSLLSTDHLSGNPSLRPFLPIPDWLEEISLDRLHGGDSKKEQRWDIQIVMAGTVTVRRVALLSVVICRLTASRTFTSITRGQACCFTLFLVERLDPRTIFQSLLADEGQIFYFTDCSQSDVAIFQDCQYD